MAGQKDETVKIEKSKQEFENICFSHIGENEMRLMRDVSGV